MKMIPVLAAGLIAALPLATPAEPTSVAIVKPLVEIGHVKATTAFCKAFADGAAPAALSSIAFESRLFVTGADLSAYDGTNDLAKFQWGKKLEGDLRALADDTQVGTAELASLRTNGLGDPETQKDVANFADALDGAKGRQLELSRRLANAISSLADRPTYNITGAAYYNEQTGDPFENILHTPRSSFLADPLAGPSAIYQDFYFTLPGDEFIGSDLRSAVGYAKDLESREGCT